MYIPMSNVVYSSTQKEIRQRFNIVPTCLHLTHFQNLESILKDGFIYSKSNMKNKNFIDISAQNVQNIRAEKVTNRLVRSIHDYVPLFVSYKAPMVASLQSQNENLVYIEMGLDIFERNPGTLITDGNAASSNTKFEKFESVDAISILDFRIIQKTVGYANDKEKARKKAAEVLVPDQLSVAEFRRVVCFSDSTSAKACAVIQNCGKVLEALAIKNWFFY